MVGRKADRPEHNNCSVSAPQKISDFVYSITHLVFLIIYYSSVVAAFLRGSTAPDSNKLASNAASRRHHHHVRPESRSRRSPLRSLIRENITQVSGPDRDAVTHPPSDTKELASNTKSRRRHQVPPESKLRRPQQIPIKKNNPRNNPYKPAPERATITPQNAKPNSKFVRYAEAAERARLMEESPPVISHGHEGCNQSPRPEAGLLGEAEFQFMLGELKTIAYKDTDSEISMERTPSGSTITNLPIQHQTPPTLLPVLDHLVPNRKDLPIYLNGRSCRACADFGAASNAIDEAYALELGIVIDRIKCPEFQLPTDRKSVV